MTASGLSTIVGSETLSFTYHPHNSLASTVELSTKVGSETLSFTHHPHNSLAGTLVQLALTFRSDLTSLVKCRLPFHWDGRRVKGSEGKLKKVDELDELCVFVGYIVASSQDLLGV